MEHNLVTLIEKRKLDDLSRPQRWGATQSLSEPGSQTQCRCCVTNMREPLGSSGAGIFIIKQAKITTSTPKSMSVCSVCGEEFENDIRFLNHMMEKHGFRNPNTTKPDRNSRGY